MTEPYAIDKDHQAEIEQKIISALSAERVSAAVKKSLSDHIETATDALTAYLKDEYALVIEDIVRDRAKRLVAELLKGNPDVAARYGLVQFTDHRGQTVSYDIDACRAAIVLKFKDQIVSAEMAELIKERDNLKRDNELYRDADRRRYG